MFLSMRIALYVYGDAVKVQQCIWLLSVFLLPTNKAMASEFSRRTEDMDKGSIGEERKYGGYI